MHNVNVQGVEVPSLGFGTWQLQREDCREAVEHALAIGYRHIDTAQMYGNEDEVGKALRASSTPRQDVFVTTKLQSGNLDPDVVADSTRSSLEALGTDYVDLLLIHWPDPSVPAELTLAAMADLCHAGTVRHIGVSNFPPAMLAAAAAVAPVLCDQVEYHPYLGQNDLLAVCGEHDIMCTAYSPLARGKVSHDAMLQEIANGHGKSPAQVTLRWLIQQPRVAAIPKARSAAHRESNFDIFDFALTEEEMAQISALDVNDRLIDPPSAPDWQD